MAALKYKVELNESERTHLKQMASRGETSARKVKRARVAEGGRRHGDIASGLLISDTVGRVRTRFVKEELDSDSMSALDRDRSASWTADRKHI